MTRIALFATVAIWAFILGVRTYDLFSHSKVAEIKAMPAACSFLSESLALGDIAGAQNQTFSDVPTSSLVLTSSNPRLVVTAATASQVLTVSKSDARTSAVNVFEATEKQYMYYVKTEDGDHKLIHSTLWPLDFPFNLKGHNFARIKTVTFGYGAGGYNVYRCTKHQGEEEIVGWAR